MNAVKPNAARLCHRGWARTLVHDTRHEADTIVYESIDHMSSDIFHLANQMRKENVDV